MAVLWLLVRVRWRRALGPSDIVVSDVGAHKVWVARMYQAYEPNTVIISNGFAAMGISVPGAIAAKLVHPDRRVVALCGDGGFLMTIAELQTAQRENLPIIVLVFDDLHAADPADAENTLETYVDHYIPAAMAAVAITTPGCTSDGRLNANSLPSGATHRSPRCRAKNRCSPMCPCSEKGGSPFASRQPTQPANGRISRSRSLNSGPSPRSSPIRSD